MDMSWKELSGSYDAWDPGLPGFKTQTLACKESDQGYPRRKLSSSPIMAVQVEPGKPMPKQAVIDAHFWGETDTVEIRSDLAHTHIYICAPEVLMLFSDNFDYQVGRHDPQAWIP